MSWYLMNLSDPLAHVLISTTPCTDMCFNSAWMCEWYPMQLVQAKLDDAQSFLQVPLYRIQGWCDSDHVTFCCAILALTSSDEFASVICVVELQECMRGRLCWAFDDPFLRRHSSFENYPCQELCCFCSGEIQLQRHVSFFPVFVQILSGHCS